MRRAILVCAYLLLAPLAAAGQGDDPQSGAASGSGQSKASAQEDKDKAAVAQKIQDAAPGPKFVRTLTNVQVELTLTDHIGPQPPEKKTVSMIVSSGNWGKVRSVGTVHPPASPPYAVDLNVDARPFVTMEGQIQLELTLVYSPPGGADKDTQKPRPTGVNQSLTVVLQSGKPLIVSQAADPISDRRVIVEVKATVLK